MSFMLRISLNKDDLRSHLELRKDGIPEKDFKVLKKVLEKASNGDIDVTKPLTKFLNNDELSYLVEKGWSICHAAFTVSENDLLEYYKGNGPLGGTPKDASDRWPHIPDCEIGQVNTRILYHRELLSPTRFVSCNSKGGYVLKSFYDENQKLMKEDDDKKRQNSVDSYMKNTKQRDEVIKKAPKKDFTKAKQKALRKEILSAATSTDVCNVGFKEEFINSLNEDQRSYMESISDLQKKLMRSEVIKNDK